MMKDRKEVHRIVKKKIAHMIGKIGGKVGSVEK